MVKTLFQFLVVALVGAALLAIAHLVAPGVAEQQPTFARLQGDVNYERTFLSVAVCILLLMPTYGLFVLSRRSGPGTLWRAFWTVSWVAFLVHLYWAVRLLLENQPPGHRDPTWDNIRTAVFTSRDLVSLPEFDVILTAWWTFDVLLAWLLPYPFNGLGRPRPVRLVSDPPDIADPPPAAPAFVRLQRELLNPILFVAMLGASIPQGHGLVRTLGFLLAGVGLTALAARVLLRPFRCESLFGKLYKLVFSALNRFVTWDQLPTWFGVINLGALREVLRARNLQGTDSIPVSNPVGLIDGGNLPPFYPRDLVERRDDGCYNDLAKPTMGRSSETSDPSGDTMLHDRSHPGARFGRNVPLEYAFPDVPNLLEPNPRRISNELLARKKFIPAEILNLLAAAWIQFQTHDWFNHGEPIRTDPIDIPPPAPQDGWTGPMSVGRTRPDPTRDYAREPTEKGGRLKYPPTYVNAESHWWDASQIYGNSEGHGRILRTDPANKQILPGGKLYIDNHGIVPTDPSDPQGLAVSGFVGNWWLGLSLLHAIFVKEHNAICDHLTEAYPEWSGDRIFGTARMINAALMAKIHTVEWTPAILQNPALQIGMAANWWGLLTEDFTRAFGRISPTEAFSGIPNSGVEHHTADFTLSEEFVSVYRLHPLMPDELKLLSFETGQLLQTFVLPKGVVGPQEELIIGKNGSHLAEKPFTMTDVWYSFGRANPGAVTLHNYPNFLRRLNRETPGPTEDATTGRRQVNRETIDLAVIDILRDRERGVPRYNQFRSLFHLKPIRSFDEFNNPLHPYLAQTLRGIYGQTDGRDNVDRLDLMVGMFAEVPPEGFGFSDTAFRVFILMASRRLKSDRFIAQGFNADVFTAEGVAWVNDNSMLSVLHRHHPELAPALYGLKNAFVPWQDVFASANEQRTGIA